MRIEVARLFVGAGLVAGGAALWAFTGVSEAGAAMIAAGGVLIPVGAKQTADRSP